jgi:hypothetical protein
MYAGLTGQDYRQYYRRNRFSILDDHTASRLSVDRVGSGLRLRKDSASRH